MTSKLRALLVLVGTVTVGGVTALVAIPDAGVTRADIIDAGIADCPRRHLRCDVRVSDEGRNVLADAGVNVSRRYVPMRVRGRLCTDTRAVGINGCGPDGEEEGDGGCIRRVLVLPVSGSMRRGLSDLEVLRDSCELVAQDGTDLPAFEVMQSRCVAAPSDGGTACRRSERDGGFRYFGADNSMLRSESNGHATCEATPCVVLAGESP